MFATVVTRINISYRYSNPATNVVIYRGGRHLVFSQVQARVGSRDLGQNPGGCSVLNMYKST